jgi:hypothetical protein
VPKEGIPTREIKVATSDPEPALPFVDHVFLGDLPKVPLFVRDAETYVRLLHVSLDGIVCF